ncbi:uncharacterized protein LOC116342717 [Contarinia nasturtii]|uniref:uncharacterized protein LOC116342717 n=1 Tax=Contarinia nasturtii TaxID=265458 RepID=UPI0012D3B0EB|nr:uncharacterized protein LOC116342717 [Contarinia nasturtii]
MNRKFLCLFLCAIISLELLVPCANCSGTVKKMKKIGKAAGKGAMETAKGIGKSTAKFGVSTVKTVGYGINTAVNAADTGLAIGLCPIACLCGCPGKGIGLVEKTATELQKNAVHTVTNGINAGKRAGIVGKKVATSPYTCGKNAMQEMAEIEHQEEILEALEEEKRRKLKELPGPSN